MSLRESIGRELLVRESMERTLERLDLLVILENLIYASSMQPYFPAARTEGYPQGRFSLYFLRIGR
jgi:hypothetical protein